MCTPDSAAIRFSAVEIAIHVGMPAVDDAATPSAAAAFVSSIIRSTSSVKLAGTGRPCALASAWSADSESTGVRGTGSNP